MLSSARSLPTSTFGTVPTLVSVPLALRLTPAARCEISTRPSGRKQKSVGEGAVPRDTSVSTTNVVGTDCARAEPRVRETTAARTVSRMLYLGNGVGILAARVAGMCAGGCAGERLGERQCSGHPLLHPL